MLQDYLKYSGEILSDRNYIFIENLIAKGKFNYGKEKSVYAQINQSNSYW